MATRENKFTKLATSFLNARKTNNHEELALIAQQIRRGLADNDKASIIQLTSTRIVPHIIKLLDYEYFEHESLIIECAWIVANVSSGTSAEVRYVIEHDIIVKAISLLDHSNEDIKDNAIWILANVAGNSFEDRDTVLAAGIVPKLESVLLSKGLSKVFFTHVAWLISSLCRGQPHPPFAEISPLMDIVRFIMEDANEESLVNCMWCLSYFSHGDDEQLRAVLDLGVTDRIISSMSSSNVHLVAAALRTAGNLLTGSDESTETMISYGVIPALAELLKNSSAAFRKETCWALSNIMAGSDAHIQEVFNFNNGEIIERLIELVYTDRKEIAKECTICLANVCNEGNMAQIQTLVDYDIIELFVNIIRSTTKESELLLMLLEALEAIFECGDTGLKNPFIDKFAQCEGYPVIERLENNTNDAVSQMLSTLIEHYLDNRV